MLICKDKIKTWSVWCLLMCPSKNMAKFGSGICRNLPRLTKRVCGRRDARINNIMYRTLGGSHYFGGSQGYSGHKQECATRHSTRIHAELRGLNCFYCSSCKLDSGSHAWTSTLQASNGFSETSVPNCSSDASTNTIARCAHLKKCFDLQPRLPRYATFWDSIDQVCAGGHWLRMTIGESLSIFV